MIRERRDFLQKLAAWGGTSALATFAAEPFAQGRDNTSATTSLPTAGQDLNPVAETAPRSHSTSGPLLDWFYVHAGYVNYKKGYAELWDVPEGVEIAVQQAEKSRPLIVPDRPWEHTGIGYISGTYKRDDKYVMHYLSYDGYQCIAESNDGFNWTKPDLGLVEFHGSKDNNILFGGPGADGHVFEDPSAPPSERYKVLGMREGLYYPNRFDKSGNPVPLGNKEEQSKISDLQESLRGKYHGQWGQLEGFLVGAVSPDGLHWKHIKKPLLAEWVDGDYVAYYDETTHKYVAYLRFFVAGRRSVGRSVTADFRTFPPETVVLQADSLDPPDTSIYNNAYTRYPGRDDLHLMFASMFHQAKDNIDIQLALSHDGLYWVRPDRITPLIPNGPPGSNDGGCIYVGPGIVELPDGRWAATYFGTRELHNSYTEPVPATKPFGTIRFAMWKRDRLAGIRAREFGRLTLRQDIYRPGQNCPAKIPAPPNNHFPPLRNPNELPRQLKLNYKTEVGGWIRVELIPWVGSMGHPQIPPIGGYSFGDCDVLTGDEIEKVVTWKGKTNVAHLSDTLAVRIRMYKATLFSFAL